jgi:hypothetical protein
MNEAQQIATSYQFTPEQFELLKRYGVKQSTSGRELYFPPSLYDELQIDARKSRFKQDFNSTVKLGDQYLTAQVLGALKKSLNSGNTAEINNKTFYVLKGNLTRNNNFNFPNPYRKDQPKTPTEKTNIQQDMDPKSTRVKRTPESIKQEASKYTSPSEFFKTDPASYLAYTRAVSKGIVPNQFPDAKRGRKPGSKSSKITPTPSNTSTPEKTSRNLYNDPYFGNTTTTFDDLKEGQFITEAKRLQKLAGIIKENK